MEEKKRARKKQLFQAILKQVEFYFSPPNLAKDRFMSQCLEKNQNGIELSVLLTFNKLKALTTDIDVLKKALRLSELLLLTENENRVKSKVPYVPKSNTDDCTIYVEHLPPDADQEWLHGIFSPFGSVDYVSLPKFTNGKIKGFAFVEFSDPKCTENVLQQFKECGSYLSMEMAPAKLCSISTYEGKSGNEQSTNEDKLLKSEDEMDESSNVQSLIDESLKTKVNNENLISEKDEELDCTVEKYKTEKRKLDLLEPCDYDIENAKKTKIIKENFEDKGNEDVEETSELIKSTNTKLFEDDLMEKENSEVTKKGRRKKKKSKKEKVTATGCGLQILSKSDWKKLRNKYLNMQKEKMQMLKKHLSSSRARYGGKFDHRSKNNRFEESSNGNGVISFPNTVVKIMLDEPVINVKEFKAEVKKDSNVQYVDIKEGYNIAYIRLTSPEAVKMFCKSSPWTSVLLSGAEEKNYWNKIKQDRSNKSQRNKRHVEIDNTKMDINIESKVEEKCKNKCAIEFNPHTVVKVNMSEPVIDLKQFKNELREQYPDILYIDIKEGNNIVFFRMKSPEAVELFITKTDWSSVEVLEGDEEQEYWNKIQEDRTVKYQQKIRTKKKGKQKLIRKAENVLRKHIVIGE